MHRLNYTCKTMEPLHSNMQSVEDVLEWQHDMKKRLKKDKIDVWCNDTTTLRHDISRRFGLWAPEGQRVFGTYNGNHISRFINGAVSLSGKRFFTATNTLATPVVIDFLPICSSMARQDCRHFRSSIVEQVWQNETVSCR